MKINTYKTKTMSRKNIKRKVTRERGETERRREKRGGEIKQIKHFKYLETIGKNSKIDKEIS